MPYLITIPLYLLISYAGLVTLYLLLFSLAGRFRNRHTAKSNGSLPTNRIAVLIPAYKEDAVILDAAQQALHQSYPASMYEIIIIADSLHITTLNHLRALPICVIEVSFRNPTKAKALNAAMQQLPTYDIAVILDADNIMAHDFLEKINEAFHRGYQVIQGHRTAKNTHTSVALLDAISEEINNHIFRKGHRALGFSSALIGSGMAFNYSYFKETLALIHTTGGFDKELELRTLKQKILIEYLEDALVFDEKVPNAAVFKQQRTRWIAAQIKYLRHYFFSGWYQLIFEGNIDFFDKVIQTMLPPRILLLGLYCIILPLSALLASATLIIWTFISLFALLLALYLAIPTTLLRQISFREIANLPKLFVQFVLSFRHIRQAQKKFIHTPHGENG